MTPFDRVCHCHGIEHRLTKVKHPWTNGQVERMKPNSKGESRMDKTLIFERDAPSVIRRKA